MPTEQSYKKQSRFANLFYEFWGNLRACYTLRNLWRQLLAVILTYVVVISNFDWKYFTFFRNSFIYPWLFPAAIIGGLLPILLPLIMFAVGRIRKNLQTLNTAFALGQAAIMGWAVSSFYKVFTGRDFPPQSLNVSTIDTSHIFKFGILRAGIFWGWPSSHTTIAVAMATALIQLYPKNKTVRYLAAIYALYIGLGVSVSIHWFSDFAAGIIFGMIIGLAVGRSFKSRLAQVA